MTLLPAPFSISVGPSPEWEEVFHNYSHLIRLSQIERTAAAAALSSPRGHLSGDDEERQSPASSPVGMSAAQHKYLELTAPLPLELPPPMPNEEAASYRAFAGRHAAAEEAEKHYIAFIFQEYCKRKTVEQRWQHDLAKIAAALAVARSRELPPHVRNLIGILEENEAREREEITTAYDGFLRWVGETTPVWLEAVRGQEAERERHAEAKRAALAAAKAALAEELAQGRQLPDHAGHGYGGSLKAGPGGISSGQLAQSSPLNAALPPIAADGTLNYSPSATIEVSGVHRSSPEPAPGDGAAAAGLSESELRLKAIRMLEAEEEAVKRRRAEQLEGLRRQEGDMRASMAARERQRTEEEARQAGARAEMLEHITAEEELLLRRMDDREARRVAAKEETRRVKEAAEAEARRQSEAEKAQLYEHVLAEEELLRRRLRQRDEEQRAREAQEEDLVRQRRRQQEEERRVRQEQEDAMHRAREEAARAEKDRQLRLLAEQEEAVKGRLRARELSELQARESERHREFAEAQRASTAAAATYAQGVPGGYYAPPPAHMAPPQQDYAPQYLPDLGPVPPAAMYDPYRPAPPQAPYPGYPAGPYGSYPQQQQQQFGPAHQPPPPGGYYAHQQYLGQYPAMTQPRW